MIADVIRWSARNVFLVGLATVFVIFAGVYAVSRVPLDASGCTKARRAPSLGPDATGVGWVYQYVVRGAQRSLAELRNTGGQSARRGTQIFEDTRARPIKISAILENHVDERHAKEREPTYYAGLRHAQQRGAQGIGDLILDHLWGLAGIFGVYNHLHVRERE